MGSLGASKNNTSTINYPVYGKFTASTNKQYVYILHEDGIHEVFLAKLVKGKKGTKYKEVAVRTPNELKKHILDRYGL